MDIGCEMGIGLLRDQVKVELVIELHLVIVKLYVLVSFDILYISVNYRVEGRIEALREAFAYDIGPLKECSFEPSYIFVIVDFDHNVIVL